MTPKKSITLPSGTILDFDGNGTWARFPPGLTLAAATAELRQTFGARVRLRPSTHGPAPLAMWRARMVNGVSFEEALVLRQKQNPEPAK